VWIAYLAASRAINQANVAAHQFRKGILAASDPVGPQQLFILHIH